MNILNVNCWKYEDHPNQSKVSEKHYDRNVDYDWWNSTYDYIKTAIETDIKANRNVKINGFDLDRGSYIDIQFDLNLWDVVKYLREIQRYEDEGLDVDGNPTPLECPTFFTRSEAEYFLRQFKQSGFFRWKKYFDGTGEYELDMNAETVGRSSSNAEWECWGDSRYDEREGSEDDKDVSNIEKMFRKWADLMEEFVNDIRDKALQSLRREYDYQTGEGLEEWLKENIFDEDGDEVTEYETTLSVNTDAKYEADRMWDDPSIAKGIWEYCRRNEQRVHNFLIREFPGYEEVQYDEQLTAHDLLFQAIVKGATQGRLF